MVSQLATTVVEAPATGMFARTRLFVNPSRSFIYCMILYTYISVSTVRRERERERNEAGSDP